LRRVRLGFRLAALPPSLVLSFISLAGWQQLGSAGGGLKAGLVGLAGADGFLHWRR